MPEPHYIQLRVLPYGKNRIPISIRTESVYYILLYAGLAWPQSKPSVYDSYKKSRNSAVADKPIDALVQMNGLADLNIRPSALCYQ